MTRRELKIRWSFSFLLQKIPSKGLHHLPAPHTLKCEGKPQLPPELIIRILGFLDLQNILWCRTLSHSFNWLIHSSLEIKYKTKLEIAGLVENSFPEYHNPIHVRLRALEKSLSSWNNPRFTRGNPVSLDFAVDAYVDHIFCGARRRNQADGMSLWDELHFKSPSTARRWYVSCESGFETYALDPSADRLVFMRHQYNKMANTGTYILNQRRLSDGNVVDIELMNVQAPRRDFLEAPYTEIAGNMLGIASGGLYGDVNDHERSLRVTVVNLETGRLQTKFTRRCSYGIDRNRASFTFASPSCFLLGIRELDHFAIEVYLIPNTSQSGPVHAATFQFPTLRPGCASTDGPQHFAKSYYGSTPCASQRPTPKPSSVLLHVNRVYYGARSTAPGTSILSIMHISTFLDAAEMFKKKLGKPLIFPWQTWGPSSTRCFRMPNEAVGLTSYGSHVLLNGHLLDFNCTKIARDVQEMHNKPFRSYSGNISLYPLPGNIVKKNSVIPHAKLFIQDIVSNLPYRDIKVDSLGIANMGHILAGSVWVSCQRAKNGTQEWEYQVFDI